MFKASYILNSARDADCLEAALGTLQSIKREREEFLVVYAGGGDVSDLRTRHPWVDQWIVEQDTGEAHGLNKGILASRGEIIRSLSDEDMYLIDVVHEAIDLCVETDLDVVFVAGKTVDPNGTTWEHSGRLQDILAFKSTCGLAMCFRRSILPLVGLLDSRFISTDVDFICRVIRSGVKIGSIEKVGFIRKRNESSLAVRFADRSRSDKKMVILGNSDLYLGPDRIQPEMIGAILESRGYADWLGSYINQGLLKFSEFEQHRQDDDEAHSNPSDDTSHSHFPVQKLRPPTDRDSKKMMTTTANANTRRISEAQVIDRVLSRLVPLNEPRIMMNVGASNGHGAREYARKGWGVYAFEANPFWLEQSNAADPVPNCHIFNKAIALSDEKSITFYVSPKHPGIGSLRKFHDTHVPIEVEAVSLRHVYETYSIKAIDFFKIDAETMDLEIMNTHDWSIPIASLLMEYTYKNIEAIYEFVMSKMPAYRHTIFEWVKPYKGCAEVGSPPASCFRMSSISEYKREKIGDWGNIFFYLPSSTMRAQSFDL